MTTSSHSTSDIDSDLALAQASHAFLTAVPQVTMADAEHMASQGFGLTGVVQALSGERDKNFLVHPASSNGSAATLKFINSAEQVQETSMQIEVLKHLQGRCPVPVPRHMTPTRPGIDWIDWATLAGESLRVRCYSFLQGRPGSDLQACTSSWLALGSAIAQLHTALIDFHHPAATREFLWDARRAPLLRPWLEVVDSPEQRHKINDFWTLFADRQQRWASQLPVQVIHNDLSPSNLLADAGGQTIAGVLDFGDMLHAPRVVDLAIAASYQMVLTEAPAQALQAMVQGYESLAPLQAIEHELLSDYVLARLTQRMVITGWRARCYPDNSAYILRSQASAAALFERLIDTWLQQHA